MDYMDGEASKKSIIKAPGTASSKVNDGFARVTWTDLAMGSKAIGKKSDDARSKVSSKQSGNRPLIISPEVAAFNLANQNVNDYEEIKGEGSDGDQEEIQDDLDAPQTFKHNFVRRATKIRQQILEDDDDLKFLQKSPTKSASIDGASDRPRSAISGRSSGMKQSDAETDANDEEEDEDQALFGGFKFRSFKTQKLIDEDYELLNIEDPEDVTNITVNTAYPEDKVSKEQIELVPVTK